MENGLGGIKNEFSYSYSYSNSNNDNTNMKINQSNFKKNKIEYIFLIFNH